VIEGTPSYPYLLSILQHLLLIRDDHVARCVGKGRILLLFATNEQGLLQLSLTTSCFAAFTTFSSSRRLSPRSCFKGEGATPTFAGASSLTSSPSLTA
jgi:hypothetical protein